MINVFSYDKASGFPSPHGRLLLSVGLISAVLTGVKLYLTVVLFLLQCWGLNAGPWVC